jgi:hypothetical protein
VIRKGSPFSPGSSGSNPLRSSAWSVANLTFGAHSIGEPMVGIQPRDLVVPKASVVDAELEKLDLKLRTVQRATLIRTLPTF